MNLSTPFIQRPVMTMLSMVSILLFGIVAYRALPVSDLPNVDRPTIQVSANLAGASAETMASAVATPLEKEFSSISGIEAMSSSSSQGSTSVTLDFVLDRDIDAAAQDVNAAISRALRKLPADMNTPPSYRKVNPADQPILFLVLTSADRPMYELDELGQTMMAQRISTVSGVAQVQVFGSQKRAVRAELDPYQLAARGIGIDEVPDAIARQNVNKPLGTLSGPRRAYTLQANGQLLTAEQYEPLVVVYRNGRPVRLGELGDVSESVENDKTAAWFVRKGETSRAIILAVQRQPGTNTIEVADAVKALLPEFRAKLPASVILETMRDSSLPIRESAHDVQFTLLLTLALVVMVIFLFLRNVSATIIPSLVLPMSIIGTFIVMYLLDYSLDNLSLMALTLSVGFVVDDAIVMLENIVRHMEMGKPRLQAALDGSREIGFTIVSMTLSLAAVFIPVLFMSGIVGRLFREFSVTIGAAVLVSGFVSLTLTPMLASRFLKNPHEVHHGLAYRISEWCFNAMLVVYSWTLLKALKHRRITMAVSAGLAVAMVKLAGMLPFDFIPLEDRDLLQVSTEAAQDTSFDAMSQYQAKLAARIADNPNVKHFMSRCGSGQAGSGSASTGGMSIVLKPRDERTASADEIVNQLRPQLNGVPGVRAMVSNPPAINVTGRQGRSPYMLSLQASDTDELYDYAGRLEGKMRTMPSLVDISSDMQLKNQQVTLKIDRDQATAYRVTPLQIEEALYNAYGARQVSTIYAPNNQYSVILELQARFQTDPSVLSMLYIRSATGDLVPLRAVCSLVEDVGPLSINHTGQLPSVTLSFNLAPGVALSRAMDELDALVHSADYPLPDGVTYSFQGAAQAFKDSMRSMLYLLILAIVVIYIVLGILYESVYHPLTILSALPFAGFGALLTLWYFGMSLSVYAFVGIIMLVGLVKKNGIMMVDFAIEAQRKEGKTAHDAIHEACCVRFRPIMMTTLAALMGGLPIAVGYGAGGESRQPLGLAVVGGLLFSQALTLYVTPVFFLYMEKLRRGVAWLMGTRLAGPVAPAGAAAS